MKNDEALAMMAVSITNAGFDMIMMADRIIVTNDLLTVEVSIFANNESDPPAYIVRGIIPPRVSTEIRKILSYVRQGLRL